MHELDFRIIDLARRADQIVDRRHVLALGGTDQFIEDRVQRGQWLRVQRGVYLVGIGPPSWRQLVRAGIRAAGEGAAASHRAALVLWNLGISTAPVELVVPHNGEPEPSGAIVHRSRRIEPVSVIDGIEVTSVERTLLEAGAVAPPVIVEKAFSTAWRRNLTSPAKCERYLEHHGGKGRRGAARLREVVALYAGTRRSPGSHGEVAFLRTLRAAGIEEPERQFEIDLSGGTKATVDFAWPRRRKLIEFVGLEVHADSRAHAADTLREGDILDISGWQLRRFAPETLRTHPEEVARRVLRFLGGASPPFD